MTLYNCKNLGQANQLGHQIFIVTKFDEDLNPESSYRVTETTCECPAGVRPRCRHRSMLTRLKAIADSPRFFDFDNDLYCDPLGEASQGEPAQGEEPNLLEAFEAIGLPTLVVDEHTTEEEFKKFISPALKPKGLRRL